MSTFSDDERDAEMSDLRAEREAEKRYLRKLYAHPDCRDPDHPGCATCADTDEGDDDGEDS